MHNLPNSTHDEVALWLRAPGIYPDRPEQVEVIETHISWVFLTRQYAWKLKKPVRFDFLDFSSPEARLLACRDEVRLNARLAEDVYLGVVPITRDATGRLQLDGTGEPVDWLVKMRRLPAERRLDTLIAQGTLPEDAVEKVAAMLASFYRGQPPVAIDPTAYVEAIEHHVRDNRTQLLRFDRWLPPALVKRTHAMQLETLTLWPQQLARRVERGRVVEGHGDLRPEHIYLLDPPVAIDCIEFSEELRQIDVADELSFLAMACDYLTAPAVGRQLVEHTLAALGDEPDARLLQFYKSYRACVRAKVAALRSEQIAPEHRQPLLDEALRYLQLADGYAAGDWRHLVVVVRGLMGTGKTTLATAVSDTLGAEHFQTDRIRQELLGPGRSPEAYGQGRYGPKERGRVYAEMFRRAEQALACRLPVVLDGTFLTRALRDQARALAQRQGAACQLIRCQCPGEVAQSRIAARFVEGYDQSEARPELLASQQREEEPEMAGASLEIDTTEPLADQVQRVRTRLAEILGDERVPLLGPNEED